MARKDDIFISFIEHPSIKDKYEISKADFPRNLREGLSSNHTIIKSIALIVDSQERYPADSPKALYTKVSRFLNTEAL